MAKNHKTPHGARKQSGSKRTPAYGAHAIARKAAQDANPYRTEAPIPVEPDTPPTGEADSESLPPL